MASRMARQDMTREFDWPDIDLGPVFHVAENNNLGSAIGSFQKKKQA